MKALAYHEAGHAVIARFLGRTISSVVLTGHTGTMRAVPSVPQSPDQNVRDVMDLCTRARALMPIGEPRAPGAEFVLEAFDRGVVLMAGDAAEQRFCGEAKLSHFDLKEATAYAGALALTPEAVDHYLEAWRCEAAALVSRYSRAIGALADALIERKSMTGVEVDTVIDAAETQRIVDDAKAHRKEWERRFRELETHPP